MKIAHIFLSIIIGFSAMTSSYSMNNNNEQDQQRVTLVSSDGQEFPILARQANNLITARHLIEDAGIEQPIPLPNVTGKTLQRIIEILTIIHERNDAQLTENEAPKKEQVEALIQHLKDFEFTDIKDLFLAANYLDIAGLTHATGALLGAWLITSNWELDDPMFNNINGRLGFFIIDRLFEYAHTTTPNHIKQCHKLGLEVEKAHKDKAFKNQTERFYNCLKNFKSLNILKTSQRLATETRTVVSDTIKNTKNVIKNVIKNTAQAILPNQVFNYLHNMQTKDLFNWTTLMVKIGLSFAGFNDAIAVGVPAIAVGVLTMAESQEFLLEDLASALVKAIQYNHEPWVTFLLHEAEKKDMLRCLYKPLWLSPSNHIQTSLVNIVSYNAKRRSTQTTALLEAIKSNNTTLLKLLLGKLKKTTTPFEWTPNNATCESILEFTLVENKTEALALILEHINNYQPELLEILLSENASLLSHAFELGTEDTVMIVIKVLKQLDTLKSHTEIIKQRGFSFLIDSIKREHRSLKCLESFLKELDTLGLLKELFEQKDTSSMTILMYTALTGHEEIIDLIRNQLEALGILHQQLEAKDKNGKSAGEYLLDVYTNESQKREREEDEQQDHNKRRKTNPNDENNN